MPQYDMRMSAVLENSLARLIADKKKLIQKHLPIIFDYNSLKEQVVNAELAEEVSELTRLLQQKDFPQAFLNRCRQRALRNQNTCLNYFSMPQGACNSLYWKIAKLLFKPQTLGDMLSILTPQVTTYIHCQESLDRPEEPLERLSTQQITLQFEQLAVETTLVGPANKKELAQLVVVNNHLFNLEEIAYYDFNLHCIFYEQLASQFPSLTHHVYQHNAQLKTLQSYLAMMNHAGQTPKQVICKFIQELRQGGSRIMGGVDAGINAQVAFTDFISYLESLPIDLKNQLLALRNKQNESFNHVIDHLRAEKCVEEAASMLQSLIENPKNQEVLNSHPILSKEYMANIKKQYKPGNKISLTNDNRLMTLPDIFLQKQFTVVEIKNEYDYLSLLLSFPPAFYRHLLYRAKIRCSPVFPKGLIEMIQKGYISDEQLHAFIEAISLQPQKFGDTLTVLQFALDIKSQTLFMGIWQAIAPEDRLPFLLDFEDSKSNLLKNLMSHGPILSEILQALTEEERDIVLSQSLGNASILHYCAKKSDIFSIIFNYLPDYLRIEMVNTLDHNDNTLLHLIAQNPKLLSLVFPFFSHQQLLEAIKRKNCWGNTVLHQAAGNNIALTLIFSQFTSTELEGLLWQPNELGQIPLHLASTNAVALRQLLTIVPTDAHILALCAQESSQESCVIHHAAKAISTVDVLLELCPRPVLLLAMRKKNGIGNSGLHLLARHTTKFFSLLQQYSQANCLTILTDYNDYGHTPLDLLDYQPHMLMAILQLLPESQRYHAIKKARRLLYNIISYPEDLKPALTLYPAHKRLKALSHVIRAGKSAIHRAVYFPRSLAIILELLPQEHRYHVLMTPLTEGGNLFQVIRTTPELHWYMYCLIPINQRLELIKKPLRDGSLILHRIAKMPDLLRDALAIFPIEHRFHMVMKKNDLKQNLLDIACSVPNGLYTILLLLPAQKRLQALNQRNSKGERIGDLVQPKPEALFPILNILTKEDAYAWACAPNRRGESLLHRTANCPQLIEYLLTLFPNHKIFNALTKANAFGNTPLHLAASNAESLNLMLNFLSHNERLVVLNQLNNRGESIIQLASESPASLEIIYQQSHALRPTISNNQANTHRFFQTPAREDEFTDTLQQLLLQDTMIFSRELS